MIIKRAEATDGEDLSLSEEKREAEKKVRGKKVI
jgi:hypothetical protein